MFSVPTARTASALQSRMSRRAVVRAGLGGALVWMLNHDRSLTRVRAADHPQPHTWLLGSASELRPSPPAAPSQAEIDELLAYQATGSDAQRETLITWGASPSVVPWTDLTLDLIKEFKPSPARAARALALVHVAIADTLTAVADANQIYVRNLPPPIAGAAGTILAASLFPSEHAAVAGAAATTLAYLFPEASGRVADMGWEAAESRLWAGANYRSDVEAGLALGRAVGGLATAWGEADGSSTVWDGTPPTDVGLWQPTPPDFRADPLDPLAGTWRTWVLPDGAAFRPAPPPAWGSAAWRTELEAVQLAVARRTPEQAAAAHHWAGDPGTVTPAGLWVAIAQKLILRDRLDSASAARALALTTIAMYDAFVCCWDAKFAYWMARPITADPTLDVVIPTPPFPSYTSGHSTVSSAAATALGGLFPADAAELARLAREAKDSRLWAGIHFPIDNETGATGGALVGRLVLAAGGAASAVESSGRGTGTN